ncbi:2OG-Fe(II) oxygenase [Pseudorhodoferax sp.]|uniref:2OG-Fe(II) oxygenase n=1 Tax=Pseudorhodoferax sp. TaxID=1993553 RepID=UPI002DD6B4CF|nr:2OG-Fe(II) oxygenase [Pseudorhodoferax sp.]
MQADAVALRERVARLDWPGIAAQLNAEGHALVCGLLDAAQLDALAALQVHPGPWPGCVAALQSALHARLVPIANQWRARMGQAQRHQAVLARGEGPQLHCLRAGEDLPLQPGREDPQAFPLQLAVLLGTPGEDFTGGAMVLTEQRPRMQSRPMVLPLRRGDGALFAAALRPHAGARGDYTVRLRHGVARVRSGRRLWLDLRFDEAG